uniref:Pigment-dispersing factor n=1 Tax=Ophionotus victoriae TaxID=667017 RepID=A0A220W0E5_9ECHI|nr:pigment-dispersing factor precursor [Ophionotus victoriae]
MHITLMFTSAIVAVLIGLAASSDLLEDKRIADNDFAQMRSIADRKNEAIAFRNLLSQILKEQGKRDVQKRLSQNDFSQLRSNVLDQELTKQLIARFLSEAGRR